MVEINFRGDEREMQRLLRRVSRSSLCEQDKSILEKFCNDCVARGLSLSRATKYASGMFLLSSFLRKSFASATREDIQLVAAQIETSRYSSWYKHDLKVTLKKFYKWLRGTEDYPEEVRWVKTTVRNLSRKLPEDLLTEEEAKRMMEVAGNARDRALVAVLYDSGCRVSEIGTLKVKHVHFDEYGAAIVVNGKTGMRRVRLVPSVPTLAHWLSFHPQRDDPEAPLWVHLIDTKTHSYLTYSSCRELITRLARSAGIKKRIHPYLFRHSSATFWADKLTEAQMNERFGWVQGSRQSATYVHLSGRQVDDSVLKAYGLKRDDDQSEPKLKPKTCVRCKTQNETISKFCASCGMALDPLAASEVDKEVEEWNRRMSRLVQDPEVHKLLIKKLRELDSQPSAPAA